MNKAIALSVLRCASKEIPEARYFLIDLDNEDRFMLSMVDRVNR